MNRVVLTVFLFLALPALAVADCASCTRANQAICKSECLHTKGGKRFGCFKECQRKNCKHECEIETKTFEKTTEGKSEIVDPVKECISCLNTEQSACLADCPQKDQQTKINCSATCALKACNPKCSAGGDTNVTVAGIKQRRMPPGGPRGREFRPVRPSGSAGRK